MIVAGQNQSGLTPLDAPGNLQTSNIGYTGFSLSWGAVSGATGYSVTVSPAGTASVSGTTAAVTNLTPGVTYTAYVTALGDGTTNDDSAPAESDAITTLASVPLAAPPNLRQTNIEFYEASVAWDAVSGATGYDVSISPASGTTVADYEGTANIYGLAEGTTYTVRVVARGNGIETADSPAATLSLTTPTAPAVTEPALSFSGVSASAFTVSWPAQESASFSIRVWSIAPTNDFTETFIDWLGSLGTLPSGWSKEGSIGRYSQEASPIKFDTSDQTLTSPVFPGSVTALSFHLRQYSGSANNASTFSVYGSSGEDGATWTLLRAIDLFTEVGTSGTDFSLVVPAGVHQFRFAYAKGAGNCGFGSFEVSGTDVCDVPAYLQGYGPAPAYLAEGATTCTIANPAAGKTNYVEVTAQGLTGRTASSIGTVIPRDRAGVISVK